MRSSGINLATVATVFRRAPSATPCIFTTDQNVSVATSTAIWPVGPPRIGTSPPTVEANTVATAAPPNSPTSNSNMPDKKPTYGPSAMPMYA
jgi:hypothetical protein